MNNESPTFDLQREKEEVPAVEEGERTRDRRAFVPRSDIYETDKAIVVVADVPGVDENTVDILLDKNVLTINGYPVEHTPEGHSLSYAEYQVGDYTRKFTLSDEIDRDGITATVKNGVLRLTLPKSGPMKARKITVRSE